MGLFDRFKGKAKALEGRVTGDKGREAEGNLAQAKGEAEDAIEHVKDAAGNVVERARDEADGRPAEHAPADEPR
jgi:uncharacterized protein YjbJ (UPF0337 family)